MTSLDVVPLPTTPAEPDTVAATRQSRTTLVPPATTPTSPAVSAPPDTEPVVCTFLIVAPRMQRNGAAPSPPSAMESESVWPPPSKTPQKGCSAVPTMPVAVTETSADSFTVRKA